MGKAAEKEVFVPLVNESFQFRCHSEIACFNACCSGLRLVLSPYDVLRLKNRLKMTGAKFMDSHTDVIFNKTGRFPTVLLKMLGDSGRPCPFVSDSGCRVYADRPGACRLYPVGRATSPANTAMTPALAENLPDVREAFFLVRERHCRGFSEDKQWTVKEWMQREGMEEYTTFNDKWLEIISSKRSFGDAIAVVKKLQMYLMACYNLEKFQAFLFKSSFFSHFKISAEKKRQLAENEKALLLFAFDWLGFSLFGEKKLES